MLDVFAYIFAFIFYYGCFRVIKFFYIKLVVGHDEKPQTFNLDVSTDSTELMTNAIPLSRGGSPIEPIIDFDRSISINDQDATSQTLFAKYMHDEFDLNKNNRPMAVSVYPFKKLKVLQLARAKLIAKENDLHRVPFAYNR
jgi:hypothetical protein